MSAARRTHRALAWIAAVTAVVWASSGAIHPLIVAIGPKPVTFQPPQTSFEAAAFKAPNAVLEAAGIGEASQLRYVSIDGHAALQVQPAGKAERVYLDAQTGSPIANADRARAITLARHYSGEQTAPVRDAWLITQFERDYPWINRLLPVWAVAFEDDIGTVVYVDTGGDRLGTLSGSSKRFWQGLFQTLHTLSFIEVPYLRPAAIGLMVGLFFATTVFGAAMLLRRGGAQTSRRFHRRLAWIAVLPALLFPATGLFKLLTDELPGQAAPLPPAISTAQLSALPFKAGDGALIEAIAVPVFGGAPLWKTVALRDAKLVVRLNEADGTALDGGDEALARRIASGAFGKDLSEAPVLIGSFDRDYGFANKRLPVWRATGPANQIWYFETRSGLVAAQLGGPYGELKQAQALLFNLLHKGHFLDPLGLTPNQRNLLMSTLAATIVLMALFGIAIRLRGRRSSLTAAQLAPNSAGQPATRAQA
ncbi:hypothetical protein [uncultured Nevskia sp.]|uniref:hypothetical protein n=1 Tax=uncultured Nevskia sp. TaxID=228950 RepID=UPI0025E84775|nr:hypothetical protein [uncultured Nevskia sp.]